MTEEVVALQHGVRSSLSCFQFVSGLFQFIGYQFFVGQNGLVLGSENLVGQVVESIMSLCCTLLGAEDQADGRVFAGFSPVFAGVVEVHMHLASIMLSFT
jgi:hypothetical protein